MRAERATTMAAADPGASAPGDDEALVARARRGDAEAFRALYDRHAPSVLALLRHRLRDRGRAEDALADTFVKAHAGLVSFDTTRSFAGWVVGIARNVALDAARSLARQGKSAPVDSADERAGEASREHDPVTSAERREGETLALELLAALPERARQVVLLRYRQGLTQSETAATLGCSRRLVATVQKEALAALARLARSPRKEVP